MLLDRAPFRERFLQVPKISERRFLVSFRVFDELMGRDHARNARRCEALDSLLRMRADVAICQPDQVVWTHELRGELDRIPLLEHGDQDRLQKMLSAPSDPVVLRDLRRRSEAAAASKDRFKRVLVAGRECIARRLKTMSSWSPDVWIAKFESWVTNREMRVGSTMQELAASLGETRYTAADFDSLDERFQSLRAFAILYWLSELGNGLMGLGKKLPRAFQVSSDGYDHGIVSLTAYAGHFISEDIGARERCVLLGRGDYLGCAVSSLQEFLDESLLPSS